jgi:hypothetical protein
MDWETDLIDAFEAIVHRTFLILIASVAQDTTHSLTWQPALGMLNPPWSSLIFDGAPPVSMNSRNSGQKQSHEGVAQR